LAQENARRSLKSSIDNTANLTGDFLERGEPEPSNFERILSWSPLAWVMTDQRRSLVIAEEIFRLQRLGRLSEATAKGQDWWFQKLLFDYRLKHYDRYRRIVHSAHDGRWEQQKPSESYNKLMSPFVLIGEYQFAILYLSKIEGLHLYSQEELRVTLARAITSWYSQQCAPGTQPSLALVQRLQRMEAACQQVACSWRIDAPLRK
jgi:hypothetical protein